MCKRWWWNEKWKYENYTQNTQTHDNNKDWMTKKTKNLKKGKNTENTEMWKKFEENKFLKNISVKMLWWVLIFINCQFQKLKVFDFSAVESSLLLFTNIHSLLSVHSLTEWTNVSLSLLNSFDVRHVHSSISAQQWVYPHSFEIRNSDWMTWVDMEYEPFVNFIAILRC